ncbi:ATP-binding protein [Arthrobacter sp.]|uniref:ATP-binding protein n=1 Tax=Arthrobacter sp. TaxID=1667 RepID=UPI003394E07E
MNEVLARRSRQGLATAETVDALHEDFEALWVEAGFVPEMDRMAFSTAVIETATNVVQHAVPASETPLQLGVDITIWSRRLEARISEIGAAPSSPGMTGPSEVADDSESGRGLNLVHALVSTVTFERHGGDNVWVLCRHSS